MHGNTWRDAAHVLAADARARLRRSFFRTHAKAEFMFAYPAHLRPGVAARGALWRGGDFTLDGGIVTHADAVTPFEIAPPSRRWLQSLHSFAWLADILAAGDGGARYAALLLDRWAQTPPFADNPHIMRPDIVARRLMSWSAAWPQLAPYLDTEGRARVAAAAGRDAEWLHRSSGDAPDGDARLTAALGLAFSGVAFADGAHRLAAGLARTRHELHRQILPDGGHKSRAPETLAHLVADMLALQAGLAATGHTPPPDFDDTLTRMRATLALLTLSDGALACFNGGRALTATDIAPLLPTQTNRHSYALASGYHRLARGAGVLVADTGAPPHGIHSRNAHAAPLAFEFAHGSDRLIVNCGSNRVSGRAWSLAARGVAAHSTAAFDTGLDDPFLRGGLRGRILGAQLKPVVQQVTARRLEDAAGVRLEGSHDMFLRSHGIRHHRRFFLADDGNDLRGEDSLLPAQAGGKARNDAFTLRFHLHPDLRVSAQHDGHGALLATRGGAGWHFRCDAAHGVAVADSVYMGVDGVPRRSRQLAIRGTLGEKGVVLRWALRRADA